MKKQFRIAKNYKTGDIRLAAALMTVGIPLSEFEYTPINGGKDLGSGRRQRTKVLFVFDLCDTLNESIVAYNARTLRASISLAFDNFNNLKSMVSNANYLTVEEVNERMVVDDEVSERVD